MAFEWTEKKIEFFKDASEYTGFHKQVADIIIPSLKKIWELYDIGCGLGLLDFYIAPHVNRLVAIDNSELAIDDYSRRLKESGIRNIYPVLEDSNEIINKSKENNQRPDGVILSFYGKPDEELSRIIDFAKEIIILITYVEPLSEKHGKPKSGMIRPTTSQMEEFIKKSGYSYDLIIKNLDFGQPFKSLEDAKLYFRDYSMVDDVSLREQLIETNLKSVEKTGNSEFPYFLPKLKDVGIIIVKK